MLHRALPFAVVVFGLAGMSGCATLGCQLTKTEGQVRACEAGVANGRAQADAEHDRHASDAGRERAAREAAGPACEGGDAHACLTVAVYDERHDAPAAAVGHAYGVACDGDLGIACFGAGRFARDPSLAYARFARGCELGEQAACEAAARVSPDRATAFHEAACALRDYDACGRAGFAFLYGAGVPADRAHGLALIALGCDHGSAASCELRAQVGPTRPDKSDTVPR